MDIARTALLVGSLAFPGLVLAHAGSGDGVVKSNPADPDGIDCGTDCDGSYSRGSNVPLIATPAAGSIFSGWSDACTGAGICTVSLSVDRSVSATFTFLFAGSPRSNEWVQRLYVAFYGRPGDPNGMRYWAVRMDDEGGSLSSIIAAFGYSDEFNRRYGNLTYSELIDGLYQQILGRAPDPEGKAWYLDRLTTGQTTLQTVALDLLGGATGIDALTVANRLDVANHFSGKVAVGCPYSSALTGVDSLAPVTYDAATAWTAKLATESRCGSW